jgi:hypothetical protein
MSIGIGIGISLTISGYAYYGSAPINIVPPFISGGFNFGDTLTTTNGTWASDSGVLSYLYQWYRGASPISGATGTIYLIVNADSDKYITCEVSAIDANGSSPYVSSNQVFVITIPSFKARVAADLGIFEAESCLNTTLTNLNNI